nr:hypothetical protein [Actinoplanes sp. N902-109]
MWCLTVATNAIVCWSTEYYGLGVAALRRAGREVDDEVLAHFYGTHSVDTDGYRPLRPFWSDGGPHQSLPPGDLVDITIARRELC